jgi:CheY-like chemotaxis protein
MTSAAGPVLLVDDDEAFVDLVGRQLEARGYEVVTAGSVEACRQLLDQGLRPALVLLDINLPAETGWSLLRQGRLMEAGAPPVVILSGTEIRPQRLREFGVAGYLPKPVPMALLTSCVARFIRHPDAASAPGSDEVLG